MAHNFVYQNATNGLGINVDELAALVKQAAPSTLLDTAALSVSALAAAAYFLREYTWDKPDPYRHIFFERPQAQEGFIQGAAKTRNIAERLEELVSHVFFLSSMQVQLLTENQNQGADAVVFWGSQSGTAEGFANRLAAELRQQFHFNTLSADLSDFDAESIASLPKEKLAFFIISTYGEGDPSDNAGSFLEWLTKLQPADTAAGPLSSLRYAAFGLGNSQYRYYNRVVDVVDQAFEKFGAQRLMPTGKADDAQGTTGEDFMAWRDELFVFLHTQLGLEQHEVKYEPQLMVVPDNSLDLADLHLGEPVQAPQRKLKGASAAGGNSPIKPLRIKSARELFPNTTRSCLHLDLDLTDVPQITYKTGDHLAVWPINPDQEVDRLLQVLDLVDRRAEPILIKAVDPEVTRVPIPSPTSIETVLRYYLEICAPVPRDTIRAIAKFAPGPAAKEFLLALGKNRDRYAHFVASKHVTVGRLLEYAAQQEGAGATWSALPLSFLIESMPRMQPRYYSISSSSVISPRNPSITALVSSTPLVADGTYADGVAPQEIPGLATNYLLGVSVSLALSLGPDRTSHSQALTYALDGPDKALSAGRVYASVRRSRFKLPMAASWPIIMVAAGTGIAPFRAFVEERTRLARMGREVGEMVMFFGCRKPDEDYLYADEFLEAEKELGGKLRVVTAFSRAQVDGKTPGYVQDRIVEDGENLVRMLLTSDASLYICGRASMAREVGQKLGQLVQKASSWDDAKTKEWAESMKRTRKWQEDVWG